MTAIVAAIRIVRNAAITFLVGSFGFTIATVVASNTEYRPWSDGLAAAALWNGALAVVLYALLVVVLLVGQGVVRLIATWRRVLP
jgi:hypothetical protein